jgi:hypothetical protein
MHSSSYFFPTPKVQVVHLYSVVIIPNNQNNFYPHSFPVSLVIVELRAAKASKREQKACWKFYWKTPII